MSRKCLTQRNEKRIRLVKKEETKREMLKKQINEVKKEMLEKQKKPVDKSVSQEEMYNLVMKLASLSRNSSKSRIRNRCLITGRPRAYYRKMGLSRIMLRELAGKGEIPGLVKSSW